MKVGVLSAIFNSDGNFPFKITLLIKSVKVMHISFASELKTFATSGFILIYAEDGSVSFPREIVTEAKDILVYFFLYFNNTMMARKRV